GFFTYSTRGNAVQPARSVATNPKLNISSHRFILIPPQSTRVSKRSAGINRRHADAATTEPHLAPEFRRRNLGHGSRGFHVPIALVPRLPRPRLDFLRPGRLASAPALRPLRITTRHRKDPPSHAPDRFASGC